jgi:hypothetical protein
LDCHIDLLGLILVAELDIDSELSLQLKTFGQIAQRGQRPPPSECILKLMCTLAWLAGCEEIQSVRLAQALHAAQSPEVDDDLRIDPEFCSKANDNP